MRYSPELDGLRAIAAALVLLFHSQVPGANAGFLGVDIFFVLSGFLITRLLIDEGERYGSIDYIRFSMRRLTRLYPALLFFLAGYLLTAVYLFSSKPLIDHLQHALIAAVYMADYYQAFISNIAYISHTWTLGVEEKFYLVWPIIISLLIKIERRTACSILAICFITATGWRAINVTEANDFLNFYYRFDTHFTGLILGSLCGMANLKLRSFCWVLGAVGLAITLYFANWKGVMTARIGFTTLELSTAILVCSRPAFLGFSVLPWLGKMSYGFYLWHYLFIQMGRELGLAWVETLFLSACGGLFFSVISYYYIEIWFRKSDNVRPSD
ncbi:acyltransferase family protein [Halopseudomonas laoshanensis]|uniref:acyltransferase family protein n=1 Tax=Halopseudomonas laoshanensis TaxID=2268758 RepID=UPI003736CEF9